jgi:hypothetical protein
MFDFSLSWTFHIWLWSIIGNKVLGLKYVGTILSTWFIEVWSQSPYWNWMLSFPNFLKCEVVKEMACVVCCLFFFRQLLIMWLGSPQYNFFWCTSTLFFLFCEWVELSPINLHGIIFWWRYHSLRSHGGTWDFSILITTSNASLVENVQKIYYHIKQLV